MLVGSEGIQRAYRRLEAIEGVDASSRHVLEDVSLLAVAYPDEDDFFAAVEATERAMRQAIAGRLTPSTLRDDLEGWRSYHFQLRREQGADADLRLVYRPIDHGIRVKGFGHRYWPASLYHRVAHGR